MTMKPKPHFVPPSANAVVQPLPRARRRFLFLSLVTLFVCAVPIFVFYATGYRYDFFATEPTITATGGLYISVEVEEGEVFLNNEPVQDSRIFRSALYIQSLMPGLQRLHVQAPGYHTWVKELPVYPHIVTEASAFLMPERPYLRPVTEFTTSTGTPVYLGIASTTTIVPFASTTVPYLATSAKATTTYTRNAEYLFVRDLFGTTTATSSSLINRVVDEARNVFQPVTGTSTAEASTTTATTTIIESDTMIFEREGEVFVRFTGSERNVPYYFCIPEDTIASTSPRYEAQLIEARKALAEEQAVDVSNLETTTNTERECRREIRIDRQGQEVKSFRFFPGTTDLLLVHRADGLFVTEVDDRAWQNTQRLYPGSVDAVTIDGGRIFIRDGEYYFELLTVLPTTN